MPIKIDNNRYDLSDSSPSRVVRSGNAVSEILTFIITPEMVNEFIISNSFTVDLSGRVVMVEGNELQKAKEFLRN